MMFRLSYLPALSLLALSLAGCGTRSDLAPVESWEGGQARPMAMAAPIPPPPPHMAAPPKAHTAKVETLPPPQPPAAPSAPPASRETAAPAAHPDLAKVEKGDTLASISERYNVPPHVIVELNRLSPPYQLEPGTMLSLSPGHAPPTAHPAQVATALPPPSAPALNDGVGERAPPPPKHAEPSYAAGVGESLSPPPPKPEPPKVAAAEPAQAPATGRVPPAARQSPVAPVAAPATVAPQAGGSAANTGGRPFAWPVEGKLVEGYGTAANGTHNDGINIAAPVGTAVHAAADGTVAYVGNELRGYGNLVLIKHDGGYLTAYAHNSKILVHRGDRVTRGQAIAKVGATGTVGEPQLHFEIRYGRSPIDPTPLLPQAGPEASAKG